MGKGEVVRKLLRQAEEVVRVRMVALDVRFYTVDVLREVSRYEFMIAVSVGPSRPSREVDEDYTTNSKKHGREEQVGFRLVTLRVKREQEALQREDKILGYATNLHMPPHSVKRVYDLVMTPVYGDPLQGY